MNKRKLIIPSAEEDAQINAGIAQDPDTMEVSAEQLAKAKRGRGRPPGSIADVRKEQVSIRLDPDILSQLRSQGAGWQSRINEILRTSLDPDGPQADVAQLLAVLNETEKATQEALESTSRHLESIQQMIESEQSPRDIAALLEALGSTMSVMHSTLRALRATRNQLHHSKSSTTLHI